jgi:hypothetical protein
MGLYRSDYIVYGWKLPHDFRDWYDDEKMLNYVEGNAGNIEIIIDSTHGEYAVFGLVLAYASSNGFDFQLISIIDVGLNQEELLRKYSELFNEDPKEYPQLFVFSRFG